MVDEIEQNIVTINGKTFSLPLDNKDYWSLRMHHDLYRLTVALAQAMFSDAKSAIDVGCYTSGIMVELDWIENRVASDINPTLKENWAPVKDVTFRQGDAFKLKFPEKFDLVLSNQTVEHLDDPAGFIEKLLGLGKGLIVSTTYETPAGMIDGHIQDPISFEKFKSWFPVDLDAWLVCHHPSRKISHIMAAIKQSHPARKA